jgi:predicted lipoprotein with Yx(FWY)xxD motif
MTHTQRFAAALAIVLGAATISYAALAAEQYGEFKTEKTTLGNVLASPKGMTLYTYDKDTSGVSECTASCAQSWPPVHAKKSDKPVGDLTIIKRPDGTLQWADKGKPLYTFAKDKKRGEVNGNGMGGMWHAVMAEQ